MIRNLAIGLVSAVTLISAANAADIYGGGGGYKDGPAYIANTWTGFYIGANGGYGWSATDHQLADGAFTGLSPEGGFGGGQIGYNWQGGFGLGSRLVLGVEADIQGSDIGDSGELRGTHFRSNLDYFGTVRGRAGYAFDRSLVYFTGGFAYGGLDKRVDDDGNTFKFRDTATGYVLGGGLEHKISPAWSVKGEYQYINLGKNELADSTGFKFSTASGVPAKDDDFHTVRIGLNYHIHQGYDPLK